MSKDCSNVCVPTTMSARMPPRTASLPNTASTVLSSRRRSCPAKRPWCSVGTPLHLNNKSILHALPTSRSSSRCVSTATARRCCERPSPSRRRTRRFHRGFSYGIEVGHQRHCPICGQSFALPLLFNSHEALIVLALGADCGVGSLYQRLQAKELDMPMPPCQWITAAAVRPNRA